VDWPVSIDDTAGNPWYVREFDDVLGIAGPVTKTITVIPADPGAPVNPVTAAITVGAVTTAPQGAAPSTRWLYPISPPAPTMPKDWSVWSISGSNELCSLSSRNRSMNSWEVARCARVKSAAAFASPRLTAS
jgi:hypothetical protein